MDTGFSWFLENIKTSKNDSVVSEGGFEFGSISNLAEPLALGDFGERGGEIMFCGTSTCRHTLAGIAKILQHMQHHKKARLPKSDGGSQMKIPDPCISCVEYLLQVQSASSKLVDNSLCKQSLPLYAGRRNPNVRKQVQLS
jgi:hypothetical protein